VSEQGFAKIRNGLREHIKKGKLTPQDLGVYLYFHLECNWSTGIYHGSALGIAYGFDNPELKRHIQRSLARLRENCYINFKKGDGSHKGYDILIDKFEPSAGKLSGKRLNAWKNGDKVIPVWEDKTEEGTEQVTDRYMDQYLDEGTDQRRIPDLPDNPDGPDWTDKPCSIRTESEQTDRNDGERISKLFELDEEVDV
jgi:hypothetical protein